MSEDRVFPEDRYDVRVCVVGDEFVTGVGDPRSLGWVGRVAARTPREDREVTLFPLGVPGETTSDLAARWREETARRFAGGDEHRLVVGLGHADLDSGTTLARSRLNLANVLDECEARGLPALVVGPAPVTDEARNERIGDLADAFADVCARRRVAYVDTFGPLSDHEDWYADLGAGDGVHPGQSGYGLLAWLVLHSGWYDWLGVPQP
ncbi:GDSL-type esterase/lipase family protein [Kineococcus sp. NUM-3379]